MEIITTLTEVAKLFGWPVVAILSVLGGSIAIWIMNQRIETLKDANEWLKQRLEEAQNFSPGALLDRLTTRHKYLNEELELLYDDFKANEEKIQVLESEKNGIAEELENIFEQLFNALQACGFNCLFCNQPNKDVQQVGIPVRHDGERFIIDIEAICQGCGHKTIRISKV
jgi:hypothetical protein